MVGSDVIVIVSLIHNKPIDNIYVIMLFKRIVIKYNRSHIHISSYTKFGVLNKTLQDLIPSITP